ncbi:MAG TPA: hypothetical protein VF624_03785 [Tepidisphaeraceae bacterium]|jgi:hypothetical protein
MTSKYIRRTARITDRDLRIARLAAADGPPASTPETLAERLIEQAFRRGLQQGYRRAIDDARRHPLPRLELFAAFALGRWRARYAAEGIVRPPPTLLCRRPSPALAPKSSRPAPFQENA